MSSKTAFVWGPISNLSASLLAALLENGWQVHLASKSVLQVSLSPLDLASSAQHSVQKALGGADKFKRYADNLVFLDGDEAHRGTTYDVALFMGLPTNYDEPRVSRAPWAADELNKIRARLKEVPFILVSSLWGGIQADGVVPEEIEFERRKPETHFEGVCQQYELKLLKAINTQENPWHLVRLPLIMGSSKDGRTSNFSGLYKLLQELHITQVELGEQENKSVELAYNPDSIMWTLPCDMAAELLVKLVEDSSRPTICNLVSTQSKLGQEWMQELGRAMGLEIVHVNDKDNLQLPGTLRSILKSNMQVKTRNLFEVLGKYHQAPMALPGDYFNKIIDFAEKNNWGQNKPQQTRAPFSQEKAREYFEEFLPKHLDKKMLKALAGFNGGLAFQISEQDDCHWLLSSDNGKAQVVPFNPENGKAQVNFVLNAQSFGQLCSGKMMFEQALLTKALQVNGGNPIQSLLACDFLRRFLRHNHFSYATENNGRILEGASKE
jgi:hypothetical protein